MTLQAFIDDSLGDDGIYVLAGYISTEERWKEFSREWTRMLNFASIQPDGRRRFKMSEMALSPNRMSYVNGFHNIINKHVILSLAIILDTKLLNKCLDDLIAVAGPEDGPKEPYDISMLKDVWRDPFYMSYRALMDSFHQLKVDDPELIRVNDRVDFYFDDTSRKTLADSTWAEYLSGRPSEYREVYGEKPKFVSDEEYLPLQAADFRAWWARKIATDLGVENFEKGRVTFETSAQPIYNLVFTVDEDLLKRRLGEAIGQALEIIFRQANSDPSSAL